MVRRGDAAQGRARQQLVRPRVSDLPGRVLAVEQIAGLPMHDLPQRVQRPLRPLSLGSRGVGVRGDDGDAVSRRWVPEGQVRKVKDRVSVTRGTLAMAGE